jgi:oligopeptidase B
MCLYHEEDDTFSLGLQASESKQYLFVESGSKNTSFIFYLDISKQDKVLVVLTPRICGIDTTASHRGNHFFIKRRSDEFYNSELVVCPLDNVVEATVLLPHRERYFSNISCMICCSLKDL